MKSGSFFVFNILKKNSVTSISDLGVGSVKNQISKRVLILPDPTNLDNNLGIWGLTTLSYLNHVRYAPIIGVIIA